jgi:hypothetical protein
MWKTHKWTVHIKGRQWLAARDNVAIAIEARRQALQNFRHFNDNPCSAANHVGHKAQELNRVSQALLGVQKHGFAVEALALPCRLLEMTRLDRFKPPAPLQLRESGRVITAQQCKHGRAAVGRGVIRAEGEGSMKAFLRPIKLQHLLPGIGEVRPALDVFRIERERAVICPHCLRRPTKLGKAIPLDVQRDGVIGNLRQGAADRLQRLLVGSDASQ